MAGKNTFLGKDSDYGEIKYKQSFSQSLLQLMYEEISKHEELDDVRIDQQYGLTVCFVGTNQISNENITLRFTNITMYDEKTISAPKQILDEIEKMDHPRILKIRQLSYLKRFMNDQYGLFFEKLEHFEPKQTLRQFLNEKSMSKNFSLELQFSIIIQVFDAIAALHYLNIPIGNIMPDNFIYNNNEIKFTNFDVFRLNVQPLDVNKTQKNILGMINICIIYKKFELIYFKSPEQRNKDVIDKYKQYSSDSISYGENQQKYYTLQTDLYLLGLMILDVVAFSQFNPRERIRNMALLQDNTNINPYNFSSANQFLIEKARILMSPNIMLRGSTISHLRDILEEENKQFKGNSQTQVYTLKLKSIPDKSLYDHKWHEALLNHFEEQNEFKHINILTQDPYMIRFKGIEINTGRVFCIHVENISQFNTSQLEYMNKQSKNIEKINHPRIVKCLYMKPIKGSQRDSFYQFTKSKYESYIEEYRKNYYQVSFKIFQLLKEQIASILFLKNKIIIQK